MLENFKTNATYKPGDRVVVRTERGVELAKVLSETSTDGEHTPPKGTIMRLGDRGPIESIPVIRFVRAFSVFRKMKPGAHSVLERRRPCSSSEAARGRKQ